MIPSLQNLNVPNIYALQIPPEDIRWDHGEENGGNFKCREIIHGRTLSNGGRRRVPITQTRRDHLIAQNSGGMKFLNEIELFNTDSLVKEVGISQFIDMKLYFIIEIPKQKY